MSVWALGVCQSRNWEAFSVDLWGQGLPKAPLQNNSRPGSWQWDTGGRCSARPDSPHLSSSLLSCTIHKTAESGSGEKAGTAAITLPIWSVWNVAMLYCMWTDTFVMSDTTTGRWEGLANSSLIPTWEQEFNCLHYDMPHAWFMLRMQSTIHACMIHLDDVLLCICQYWKSQRGAHV